MYEPWHYRYVGIEVSKKIKELNITYEEYYEYFIK
jgi:D-alanyl-D-alanine carboxypeptidase